MRSRSIPNTLRKCLPDALEGLHAVQHAVEAVVHAVPAAVRRLVDVRLHAREVGRDARAERAGRLQGDHLPVARGLRSHQTLQLQRKVVLQAYIVLQDDRHGLGLPGGGDLAHRAEVCRGAADHAPDPVHGLLRLLSVEAHGDDPLLLQPGVGALHRHVHPAHKLRLQAQLCEPRGHELLALDVPGQVQNVEGDVGLQPCLGGLHLGRRCHQGSA
mmetsp:Transcript_90803/g.265801  ORF Transcript_90803/g.265801 Transcript_90803/m.265801 type:complete len:215 (+) Transcript_90803:276-920(+)